MDCSGRVANVARVFNVVRFAGSLRRGSYNRALLRTATQSGASCVGEKAMLQTDEFMTNDQH